MNTILWFHEASLLAQITHFGNPFILSIMTKRLTRRERLQVWERHNTSKYKSSQSTFYFPKVHWSGDHDVQKIWSFVLFIKKSTACFKDFRKSQQINTYNLYISAANFSSNKNIWSIFQQIQLLLSMSTPKISYNYMY